MKHTDLILLVLCQAIGTINSYNDVINYLEEGIKDQIASSINHQFPTNAYEHQPVNGNEIIEYGTFDFIVIGSGSTGSVVANRLSEMPEWNVLLLEAGDFTNCIQDIPNMRLSFQYSDSNWGYTSVPQTTACLDMVGRRCSYPRGKGIGGSTLINGLVYARGNKRDFDRWAEAGNPGWSYDEVLPYFKKSENLIRNDFDAYIDHEYHESGGELTVQFPIPRHPFINLWLEANKEKGYKTVDYNGEEQIGASACQVNTKFGRRDHAGNAFINPIKYRHNLKILTNSYVTKLLISKHHKTVTGVQFSHKGHMYVAYVQEEVVLSAGVFGSPQILMQSGIGPARHLNQIGIKVIEDLEVGSTLRDHPTFHGLYFDSNLKKTHNPLEKDIEEYLNGYGFLTYPDDNEGLGFYQTKYAKEHNYPDLEMMMIPIDGFFDSLQKALVPARESPWRHLNQTRSFFLYVIALQSQSTGTVRLRSKNPFDYPLIDSRFLSDPANIDINTLYEGIQLALSLINTESFQKINATLVRQNLPACDDEPYLSKDYWYCVLRYFTHNVYHPVGTCPMGPHREKGAVVDSEARVHGIKNLRVADASIFPFTFSGHPNAPCVMVGEKVSDLIKQKYFFYK